MFRDKVRVSIPVFAECDPSIIYGVFDTLWAAGKVWDTVQGALRKVASSSHGSSHAEVRSCSQKRAC